MQTRLDDQFMRSRAPMHPTMGREDRGPRLISNRCKACTPWCDAWCMPPTREILHIMPGVFSSTQGCEGHRPPSTHLRVEEVGALDDGSIERPVQCALVDDQILTGSVQTDSRARTAPGYSQPNQNDQPSHFLLTNSAAGSQSSSCTCSPPRKIDSPLFDLLQQFPGFQRPSCGSYHARSFEGSGTG